MRPVLFSLLLISIYTGCSNPDNQPGSLKNTPPLVLKAVLGGTGIFLDTIPVIYVATTIENPTGDTIQFVSMSCSYEDHFTTDSKSYKVQSRYDCYGNSPVVITLPPKEKTDRYIMLAPVKAGIEKTTRLKVGMYSLITKPGDNFDSIINYHENRHQADITWSNELDLKRLAKINY